MMNTQMDVRQSVFREMKIVSGDAELYCRLRGHGPALLLIHGVACDADYFEAAAEDLSRLFTVITYDRRGYSRSTAGEKADFSVAGQAEDAAAIWRYCRLLLNPHSGKHVPGGKCDTAEGKMQENPSCAERCAENSAKYEKMFVVGSSAGCLVAAELARLYPDMVQGLFLHEPVFGGDAPMKAEIHALRENLHVAAEKKRVIQGMRIFLDAMGGVDSRAAETPMEKLSQNMKNLEIFLYHEMDDFLVYEISEMKDCRIPIRIAVGECDGGGLFHRAAASAASALGWTLVHVPGYHNFPRDLPYEFAVCVDGVFHLGS